MDKRREKQQIKEESLKADAIIKLIKKREQEMKEKKEKPLKRVDSKATIISDQDSQATLVKKQPSNIQTPSESSAAPSIWDNRNIISRSSTLESVFDYLDYRRNLF